MKIKSLEALIPFSIDYEDNGDKSTMVYISFSKKRVFLTEEVEKSEELKILIGNSLFNNPKSKVPDIPSDEIFKKNF